MDCICVSDGRIDIQMPASILDEPQALRDVLSYDTWTKRLTDEDRQYLKQFLPKMSATKDADIDEDSVL
jgi:hypothetical protein